MQRRDLLRLTAGATFANWAIGAEIPGHPSQLQFPALDFEPPKAADYRRELKHGAVAYMVEDHELPLVKVSLTVRTGGFVLPKDKVGLAGMTGSQMRAGGTKSMAPRDFDEEADFLATGISASVGATSGGASVDCIAQRLTESLALFFDMLKNPRFDQERLDLSKTQRLQGMERRNDQLGGIERREWGRLMRGDTHFSTWPSTKDTLETISREAMMEFHANYFHPSRFMFAISGDFDSDDMVKRLNEALDDGWTGSPKDVGEIPAPTHTPKPGVYAVQKIPEGGGRGPRGGDQADINQSRISMGHLGIKRDNPDHIAIGIMNAILGGDGFTSRIMSRVRSDEGLAYGARSSFSPGTYYEGTFSAATQSKNATCAEAATIMVEEIEKIRDAKVSAQELDIAKNYRIEVFPRGFATASAVASTFVADEYTHREEGYWEKYRDRVRAVSQDDVLRVAQEYLQPQNMAFLVTGNVDDVLKGNPDKPQYSFEKFARDGEIQRIPLPDPLTMEYPDEA